MGGISIKEARGFKWYFRDDYRHIQNEYQHEVNTLFWLRWVLKNNPTKNKLFVDVGGNEGMYPVMFSKRFEKIITIEPHPMNIEILKLNLELNDVHNVEIIEGALWSSEGEMKLHQNLKNDLVGCLTLLDLPDYCEPITVKTFTLDSLNLEPDVIKIDIEGGELEALKGMKNTLSKYLPFVYIEVHPLENWSNITQQNKEKYTAHNLSTLRETVKNFMDDVGYTKEYILGNTEVTYSKD